MNIDFSALDDLFNEDKKDMKKESNSNTLAEAKTPTSIDFEPLNTIKNKKPVDAPKKYNKLDKARMIQEKNVEMYGEYQKNIKESEKVRANIVKGIKAGEDKKTLLLEAIKCISLMTNDKLFYEQSKRDLKPEGENKNEQ